MSSSIIMADGSEFDPWTQNFGSVPIKCIAQGLACEHRFAGQSRFEYTVAQHCVLASRYVANGNYIGTGEEVFSGSQKVKLGALLHDTSEAVLKDIPGPFKKRLFSYKSIQNKLDKDIFRAHNIEQLLDSPIIKRIDKELLDAERAVLFRGYTYTGSIRVEPWDSKYAYYEFLRTYRELWTSINRVNS